MRAQTRNLIELLTLARHRGTYYLFMEDDFRWVPRVQGHHAVYLNWFVHRLDYAGDAGGTVGLRVYRFSGSHPILCCDLMCAPVRVWFASELRRFSTEECTYEWRPRVCCRVCPFMLRALHYALAKAQALQPGWLALRVSYGMNGVLLRVRRTLHPELSLYLSAARPPLLHGPEDPSVARGGTSTHF